MQARKPRLLVHILNHQRLLPFVDPTDGSAFWRKFAEGLCRLARRLTDMQAHEMPGVVVEKNAQENEIHDGTKFVRQAAKQFLYVAMRSDGARDSAQGFIPRLGERLAPAGLEHGMHCARM